MPHQTCTPSAHERDIKHAKRYKKLYYCTESDAVAWYEKTYPHGVCVYGALGGHGAHETLCSNPQTVGDPHDLHLCEKHTRMAHKILNKRTEAPRHFPTWT